jgi:cyclophilin family peptidyl-prolyl cis-trans isomerase
MRRHQGQGARTSGETIALQGAAWLRIGGHGKKWYGSRQGSALRGIGIPCERCLENPFPPFKTRGKGFLIGRHVWHKRAMRTARLAVTAAFALGVPLAAQDEPKGAPAPSEIVAAAPRADWVAIPAEDVLVMTLAPDAEGNPRTVVIQLMPAPFSQGWVHNIRLFARSGWYDGISVNRVQDNYVTQWGDPNYDNPEATGTPKSLPEGLRVIGEADYTVPRHSGFATWFAWLQDKNYAPHVGFRTGWPIGWNAEAAWPTHCYGMVGVGRNYSPDTGSGAELYTVIGHAPRHLDRNIALVGRVIAGMEHLSSLPRGKGALGFYAADEAHKRTPILSVRVASDLPTPEQPRFEYLSTESRTFAAYAEAIANRRDPFFITPAGGADICNIRVPVRAFVQAGG